MSDKYDCTKDIQLHRWSVEHYLKEFLFELIKRSKEHDASKLLEPEKSMYDEWTPKLKELTFGTPEYKAALSNMGDALKHHYANNRHHPEYFPEGVNGMNLIDVLEMVADWIAAADIRGQPVNLKSVAERFNISGQLMDIIANTIRDYSGGRNER